MCRSRLTRAKKSDRHDKATSHVTKSLLENFFVTCAGRAAASEIHPSHIFDFPLLGPTALEAAVPPNAALDTFCFLFDSPHHNPSLEELYRCILSLSKPQLQRSENRPADHDQLIVSNIVSNVVVSVKETLQVEKCHRRSWRGSSPGG